MSTAHADELLERSARLADGELATWDPRSTNPTDFGLADFGDGIALVASFSHVVSFAGEDGLTVVGTSAPAHAEGVLAALRRWPDDRVDTIVHTHTHGHLDLGGRSAALRHDRGETDDHTWLWLPEERIVCGGDFLSRVVPDAGNPQKVQLYRVGWAEALRVMAAFEPELFLSAHGLSIAGADRVVRVFADVASALESPVGQTLALMNAGAPLDEVGRSVRVDPVLVTASGELVAVDVLAVRSTSAGAGSEP